MQSASSRIWTRVAVSISYDDNHYTTAPGVIQISVSTDFAYTVKCQNSSIYNKSV